MYLPLLPLASESADVGAALAKIGLITDVVFEVKCDIGLTEKKKVASEGVKAICASLRARFLFPSSLPDEDVVNALLDSGALSVTLPLADLSADSLQKFTLFASQFPRLRVHAMVSGDAVGDASGLRDAIDYLRETVASICVSVAGAQEHGELSRLLSETRGREGGEGFLKPYLQLEAATPALVGELNARGVGVVSGALLKEDGGASCGASADAAFVELLAAAFLRCCRTDRADGLFTTVVCDETGFALGLVYSSAESVGASLREGRGIYYSRSRGGLWRKGDSSGAVQLLRRIDTDCDGDALRFLVVQRGGEGEGEEDLGVGCGAFCHCGTRTCWGDKQAEVFGGRGHLQRTLFARRCSAPEGSYTKRLFDDPAFLRNKLLEEAQELVEAQDKDHVAAEMADVLYFALTRMVAAGVTVAEAAAYLDRRALKTKRRPGNAKPYRIAAAEEALAKADGS